MNNTPSADRFVTHTPEEVAAFIQKNASAHWLVDERMPEEVAAFIHKNAADSFGAGSVLCMQLPVEAWSYDVGDAVAAYTKALSRLPKELLDPKYHAELLELAKRVFTETYTPKFFEEMRQEHIDFWERCA